MNLTNMLSNLSEEQLAEFSEVVYAKDRSYSRGSRTFDEFMAILKTILAELRSAEQSGILRDVPHGIQQRFTDRLENIFVQLRDVINGLDRVAELLGEVDQLHLEFWQSGLRASSRTMYEGEILENQIIKATEMAENIRRLELESKGNRKEIQEILVSAREDTAASMSKNKELILLEQQLEGQTNQLRSISAELEVKHRIIQEEFERARALLISIAESGKQVESTENHLQKTTEQSDRLKLHLEEALENINKRNKELTQSFGKLYDDQVKAIEDDKKAKELVFSSFVKRLEDTQSLIDEKLSKATGITLFHAFDMRSKNSYGHLAWLAVAILTIAGISYQTWMLLSVDQAQNTAFYVKLSLGVPAILFTGFALQQYNRERRLKEEYAFKSSISLSLEAYRKLVEDAVKTLAPQDQTIFAKFLIESVTTIFESPVDRVYANKRPFGPNDSKVFATVMQHLKDLREIVDIK